MLKKLWLASLFVCCAIIGIQQSANAQTAIAYVDAEAIVEAMPEYKNARSELEALSKVLEKQIQEEGVKIQTFAETTEKNRANLSPKALQDAGEQLQKMQEDLQSKMKAADEVLADKEAELTKPMYDKFNAALKAVAKANGYIGIFDKQTLLSSELGVDATAKLKTQLGIQ